MMWPTWLTIQTQKCRSSGPPPPRRPPVLPSVIRFPFPPTDLRPRSVPSDPTSWIECGRKEGERGSGRSPSERAREEERESHSTANGAGGRRWEREEEAGREGGREGGDGRNAGRASDKRFGSRMTTIRQPMSSEPTSTSQRYIRTGEESFSHSDHQFHDIQLYTLNWSQN